MLIDVLNEKDELIYETTLGVAAEKKAALLIDCKGVEDPAKIFAFVKRASSIDQQQLVVYNYVRGIAREFFITISLLCISAIGFS
jgi:hypothetical protein